MHGGVGIIVPVLRRAGEPAVLKVSFPHPGNVHEPDAFVAWGGQGAVLLHERDDDSFAMLLERSRASTLAELGHGDEVLAVAGRISHRLAIPAPPGLPRLRDQAETWEEQLRKDAQELTHALSPYVVDSAVETVRELGRVQPSTLVHGDLHAGNILCADREPWLAVDPKGYAGDPAYDGGTLLTSRASALLDADDLHQAAHRALDVFTEGRGTRSRTHPTVGPTARCSDGVLGPAPRVARRIATGLAHRVRGPPGEGAHRARPKPVGLLRPDRARHVPMTGEARPAGEASATFPARACRPARAECPRRSADAQDAGSSGGAGGPVESEPGCGGVGRTPGSVESDGDRTAGGYG